ncbi:MAG TPA: RNA polymerase sigma factor [Thermoanaerobaculia bacterium]|nr:RNA polymerase sigma factor [Thermoanaerobaculia bacterium]
MTQSLQEPGPGIQGSDQAMLSRIRAGDRAAAEDLVSSTYQRIYAYLIRLSGRPEDAADLTQETYRKAWQSLSSFDGRSTLSTWLHRIAYTTFLNSIRTPRRVEAIDAANEISDLSPRADEIVAKAQEDDAIRRAVLQLPADLRFTVTAHYWGEMSVRDIAEIESITSVAVRKRLAKATRLLAATMTEVSS